LGDFFSCRTLGDLYLMGHGGGKYAARQGHLPTQRIEPDKKTAITWYERGSSMGDRSAACMLGQLYLKGEYIDQDFSLAEKWLLHSSVEGDYSAQFVLGSEYASGIRFNQDSDAAIHWLVLAAEHSQRAALKLAEIYLDGKITPRNFDVVIKWLTQAADSHTFRNQAMKMVAEKCFDGRFNAAEESSAQAWLVQIAAMAVETFADTKYPAREAGNAFDLAELYELGVEPSMEIAVTWYVHAAELENRKAKTRLDDLGIDW
jgi:TPR repeat protein